MKNQNQLLMLALAVLALVVLNNVLKKCGLLEGYANDFDLTNYPKWVDHEAVDVVQPALHQEMAETPNLYQPQNVVEEQNKQIADSHLIFKDGNVPRDYILDDQVKAPQVLRSEDLLPVDDNNAWSDVNPEGTGSLAYKNFLEAGHHIGQTQVLRNAYTGLRAEYPNPQANVGPWNQATIVPNPHYTQESDICV